MGPPFFSISARASLKGVGVLVTRKGGLPPRSGVRKALRTGVSAAEGFGADGPTGVDMTAADSSAAATAALSADPLRNWDGLKGSVFIGVKSSCFLGVTCISWKGRVRSAGSSSSLPFVLCWLLLLLLLAAEEYLQFKRYR